MSEASSPKEFSANPNSALYWLPRIEATSESLPVSVPETEFVIYDFLDSFPLVVAEMVDEEGDCRDAEYSSSLQQSGAHKQRCGNCGDWWSVG